jgi:DnaK suppressor protein
MEAHMSDVRQAIESRLTEIKALIARLHGEGVASSALDQTSVGRLSRMDALQQVAMSTGYRSALERECRRLEAALERLDEGTFGLCCKCGEEIAKARLEVDLGAPFCARCQLELEDKRIHPPG